MRFRLRVRTFAAKVCSPKLSQHLCGSVTGGWATRTDWRCLARACESCIKHHEQAAVVSVNDIGLAWGANSPKTLNSPGVYSFCTKQVPGDLRFRGTFENPCNITSPKI